MEQYTDPMEHFTPEEMNEFYNATVSNNEEDNENEKTKMATVNTGKEDKIPIKIVTFPIPPTADLTSKASAKRHLSLQHGFRQHKRLRNSRRQYKRLKNQSIDGDITQSDLDDYYKYYDSYNTYLEHGEAIQNEDKHIVRDFLEWERNADYATDEDDQITFEDICGDYPGSDYSGTKKPSKSQ